MHSLSAFYLRTEVQDPFHQQDRKNNTAVSSTDRLIINFQYIMSRALHSSRCFLRYGRICIRSLIGQYPCKSHLLRLSLLTEFLFMLMIHCCLHYFRCTVASYSSPATMQTLNFQWWTCQTSSPHLAYLFKNLEIVVILLKLLYLYR